MLVNVVFCLLVAALITAFSDWRGGWGNVQISLGYGLSVQAATMLVSRWWRQPQPIHWVVAVVLGLCLGTAWAQLVLWSDELVDSFDWALLGQVLLVGMAFTAVGLAVHMGYLRQAAVREQLWQAERRELEHSRELARSELKALQAQIEPHFLFNTLASVRALVALEPAKAEQMLDHLSAMLRAVLQRSREERTTLGQELQLVQAYLDIQQVRLGSRLQYNFERAEPELLELEFPMLILQPLVENAVGHGIEPSLEGGAVHIAVSSTPGWCRVVVADTGVGLGSSPRAGQGMALENVRARLAAVHGERARLRIEAGAERGTVCSVDIPLDDPAGEQP